MVSITQVWLLVSTKVICVSFSPVFYLTGTGLALAAGAVFGWTFGHEVANHWFQLYRLDTAAAQGKFMEWLERKAQGRA